MVIAELAARVTRSATLSVLLIIDLQLLQLARATRTWSAPVARAKAGSVVLEQGYLRSAPLATIFLGNVKLAAQDMGKDYMLQTFQPQMHTDAFQIPAHAALIRSVRLDRAKVGIAATKRVWLADVPNAML